jgi:hypothetical protein
MNQISRTDSQQVSKEKKLKFITLGGDLNFDENENMFHMNASQKRISC